MRAEVEWVDARERLPESGAPVAAATSGNYPLHDYEGDPHPDAGREFWIVMPMVFMSHHIAEDGSEHHDCFLDSDKIVRLPYGRGCDLPITHWAELPTLPGTTVYYMVGDEATTARTNAMG